MDRKSKIWQIVLLALLIVAIIVIVLFNNKLKNSSEQLTAAMQQLQTEQENVAALKGALDEAQAAKDEAVQPEAEAEPEAAEAPANDAAAEAQDTEPAATLEPKLDNADDAEGGAQAAKIEALETELRAGAAQLQQMALTVADSREIITALKGMNPVDAAPSEAEAVEDTETAAGDADSATAEMLAGAEALRGRIDALLEDGGDMPDDERVAELEAVKADLNEYAGRLQQAVTELATAGRQMIEADNTIADMQAKLDEAETRYNTLSAELDEKLKTIESLNEQIASLNAQSATDAEQLKLLQTALDIAESEAGEKSLDVAKSFQEYENQVAELEAYKLTRELSTGEATAAIAVTNRIEVAADGVTANWHYDNSDISHNAVVLKLQIGDQEVYASQPIKPGESIDQVTLDVALPAGTHKGIATTCIYDAQGELQFANRVPVTVEVQ